jgi:protein-S-isoprenylcysteine O-methyltransferase Ste14
MVTHGTVSLYTSGRPDSRRAEPTLIGIEKTTKLVTTGIYRYIRHPIYGAAVVGAWGVVLKDITLPAILLAVTTVLLFTVTARIEETENIRYFGDEYRGYMKRTRMFIPFVF